MYCSNLYCSQLAPCPVHGLEASQDKHTFYEKVKETAHTAAEAIRNVFPGPNKENTVVVQGQEIVEVKTHSLEEAVMHLPAPGEGEQSRTVKTEYDTAHTWDQQHEGGLGHRAKETVKGAAETVGEKVVAAAETIKEKAADVQESLAETGHNARVKIDGALERNFGPTADKIIAGGEEARQSVIEETAKGAELVEQQLGGAASSLREQERNEQQKTDREILEQYHSAPEGRIENALEKNFGTIVQEAQLEGQKAKEGAIQETAHAAEVVQAEFGNIASSLREQQRNEQQS
jgi:hypothetical protein